jgi:D-glycero-D-manno-heptose 1,7-bisphosphate phosphatase
MTTPAIFLDRDGTINIEKNYLYRIEDWEWIPGAIKAIKLINEMGFLAIVVTNQAGIARGYYTDSDVEFLHIQVNEILNAHGARIDAYYYCPHHPEFGDNRSCDCRKPAPGLLQKAKKDFDINLSDSYLVGDKITDIEAAEKSGVQPVLVETGYGLIELKKRDFFPQVAGNLLEAVMKIQETMK